MHKHSFVIHSINRYNRWKDLFTFFEKKADTFKVFFPGDAQTIEPDNPLIRGKEEFLNLEGIAIKEWDGMDNSIQIEGQLNTESKRLFYNFQKDAFDGFMPQLWSFELQKHNDSVLRVEDFTVCILYLSEQMSGDIKKELELDPLKEWEKINI